MYNGPILYIYLIANFYKVYVSPNYGIKPYATIVAHGNFADNSRVFSQVAIVAKHWFYAFNSLY
jgi:hypothetical protein